MMRTGGRGEEDERMICGGRGKVNFLPLSLLYIQVTRFMRSVGPKWIAPSKQSLPSQFVSLRESLVFRNVSFQLLSKSINFNAESQKAISYPS